jgi:glycosyltransferase involved in cell wall biosynthesis
MPRVLQASAWYPPNHVGGTEIYLAGLVKELRELDIDSRIILPCEAARCADYAFEGTSVRRYPVNAEASTDELRGVVPHRDFSRFRELLMEERPDIYHQHSWTRGLGAAHLRAAREQGLKTVLTVHVASSICMRGTMMLFGRESCDGRIDAARCAACWNESRGAPEFISHALGALPGGLGDALGKFVSGSRAATALSGRTMAEKKKADFRRMVGDADCIVAVCQWIYDALVLNGVPKEKLLLSRQGVDSSFAEGGAAAEVTPAKGQLRLLYLGRWHPVKGIDVLLRAMKRIPPAAPITLTIHATGDGHEERACADEARRLAQGDPRITIAPPIGRDEVPQAFAYADALAVPSVWLETGPLVVLEAKAAGLPVIGSRLGGVAELIREPDEGVLVAPGDEIAWSEALLQFITNPIPRRKIPSELRTMRNVAQEMAALYASFAAVRSGSSCTV